MAVTIPIITVVVIFIVKIIIHASVAGTPITAADQRLGFVLNAVERHSVQRSGAAGISQPGDELTGIIPLALPTTHMPTHAGETKLKTCWESPRNASMKELLWVQRFAGSGLVEMLVNSGLLWTVTVGSSQKDLGSRVLPFTTGHGGAMLKHLRTGKFFFCWIAACKLSRTINPSSKDRAKASGRGSSSQRKNTHFDRQRSATCIVASQFHPEVNPKVLNVPVLKLSHHCVLSNYKTVQLTCHMIVMCGTSLVLR